MYINGTRKKERNSFIIFCIHKYNFKYLIALKLKLKVFSGDKKIKFQDLFVKKWLTL